MEGDRQENEIATAPRGEERDESSHGQIVEGYWGLTRRAFRPTPDPEFVYESEPYREALARVLYDVVEYGGGLTLVTGPAGSGKTTLAHGLIATLPRERFRIALIVDPSLGVAQMLRAMLREFGVRPQSRLKLDLVEQFLSFLQRMRLKRLEPLLVLDDAHALRPAVLAELRYLLNLEAESSKLFHVVLLGERSLEAKVGRVAGLGDRVTMRARLGPLTRTQVEHYVHFRLKVAGAAREIFTRAAIDRIAKLSDGLPRSINLIAAGALLVAASRQMASVTPQVVEIAYEDLRGTGEAEGETS